MKLFGIDLPPGRSVEGWDDWPVNAKLFALDSMKYWSLSKIQSIKPLLHKVVLTSFLTGDDLAPYFDGLVVTREYPESYRGYRTQSVVNGFMGRKWIIYSNPPPKYPRKSKVILIQPKKEHLAFLADTIGLFFMSTVEYALDFMCKNPADTQNTFNLFKRYLFVPFCRQPKLKFYDSEIKGENKTLRCGNHKLYERGPNNKKLGARKGWLVHNLDRVRLEFTASNRHLREKGIDELYEFVANPKFHEMASHESGKNRFMFARFDHEDPSLAQEWEHYNLNHDQPIGESFQKKHFEQKEALDESGKKNELARHVVSAEGFGGLEIKIRNAASQFHKQWRDGTYDPD